MKKIQFFFCRAINGYVTTKACQALCLLYSNCRIITNAINEIKDCDTNKDVQILRIGRSNGLYDIELKTIEQGKYIGKDFKNEQGIVHQKKK